MRLCEVEIGEIFVIKINDQKEIFIKIESSLNEIGYIALKPTSKRLMNKTWSLNDGDKEVTVLGKLRFNDNGDPSLTRE